MEDEHILDFQGNYQLNLKMAGFGKRLLAFVIDRLILFFFISFFLGFVEKFNLNNPDSIYILSLGFLGFGLVFLLYHPIMEATKFQGSIGKIILKLRVVDLNGQRVSFLRAVGRNMGKILSQFTFFIGYLMPLWTEKKQALHDIIAECYVGEVTNDRTITNW